MNNYIEYLRKLNILTRLDLLLLRPDETVVADFTHYTQHKMIRNRRAEARKKFLARILPLFANMPDYPGTDTPA